MDTKKMAEKSENFIYDCSPSENRKARAEIAARIMAGISHNFNCEIDAAKWAVRATDALIKELNK